MRNTVESSSTIIVAHQQDDKDDANIRNVWSRRGRIRSQARYALQNRVLQACCDDDDDESLQGVSSTSAAATNVETIQQILWRIIQYDTSFFSIPYIEKNYNLLNSPFPTKCLWWTNEATGEVLLAGEQSLLSRRGPESVQYLRELTSRRIASCTFIEYACWIERFGVVGSLVVGGIHPFPTNRRMGQELFALDVELSMKCYIVKRLLEMRVRQQWSGDLLEACCSVCGGNNALVKYFDSDQANDDNPCHHVVCESCLWSHSVQNSLESDDIVQCPVCCKEPTVTTSYQLSLAPTDCSQRRDHSRNLFYQLPTNAQELKASSKTRRRRKHDIATHVAPNWTMALQHAVGASQTVRRDRFWAALATNHYHRLHACLVAGVDVLLRNEYRQTGLLRAIVQRAPLRIVRLLVAYHGGGGGGGGVGDNGYWTVATRLRASQEVLDILRLAGLDDENDATSIPSLPDDLPPPLLNQLKVDTLIDWSDDSAGAGSFVIDNFLADPFVASLVELWQSLPVEPQPKLLCSRRSYHYDIYGTITRLLEQVVSRALLDDDDDGGVYVHPSTRFLCYATPGTILAPHVDLCRLDPNSNQRSTHSFLLYLTDCSMGGETVLLRTLQQGGELARVSPRRGRLLLFPHICPHTGAAVNSVPKLLLRGEVYIPR